MKKIVIICLVFIGSISVYAQKPEKNISTEMNLISKYIEVKGSKIYYVEEGNGDPILFLHGVPTNLYLWRNVIPVVSKNDRAIAVGQDMVRAKSRKWVAMVQIINIPTWKVLLNRWN